MEGNADGHRLYYISLLVTVAIQAGKRVIIGTTEAAVTSPDWNVHLGRFGGTIETSILEEFSLKAIDRLARVRKVEHVVVPDGDAFAFALAKGQTWTALSTVTALVMREKGQPSNIPGVAFVKTVVKSILLQIANLRPNVQIRVLKSATWRGFSLLPVSRDPVSLTFQHDSSRRRLLPSTSYWFGVVGSIGHRKNLPLVAESIAAIDRPDVGLAVAGRIEQDALIQAKPHLEQILRNGGRVEILNRLLTDSEMDQIVAELDCVVLAHSNEGPSGILGKAVAAGTNIVAAGALTLRSDCQQIGAGAEWVRLKKDPLTQALVRAIKKPRPEPDALTSPIDFAAELLGVEG